ncbi:histidine kinase [Microbacterium sp. KUDC0406]|uniref:sensor histidine kinase n=1 Tax=Microbacterium sp. KUDC0406 TaxID=2909588 RepID=UPI001F3959E1|nr:histidine kinase [Microbacterium sp. KUDC0406]UJP09215.1 histidine kinase [Microbacterium sp. KUDC0406]
MPDQQQRWWREHWRHVVFDAAPPIVLAGLGMLDAYTGMFTEPIGTAPAITALIPGTIACLALLLRRYHPLLTLVIVLVVLIVPALILPTSLTYWDEFMVWVVALYSCGRHVARPLAYTALVMSAAGMAVLPLVFPAMRDPGGILFNSALLIAGFAIGVLARSGAGYRDRLVRTAAEQAVAEERASQQERARIARELHDVISHTITVIVMQAGGARLASTHDPDAAVAALARIETLGQDSLRELRTMLTVLGDVAAGDPELTPQPTLADIPALCDRMRELGLPVRLRLADDLPPIAASAQLACYRVVQEGLTNALKHSGQTETDVSIARERHDTVRVEVANGSGDAPTALHGSGRGLIGLRERVAALRGTLEAGPRPDGGFVVTAVLPLAEEMS